MVLDIVETIKNYRIRGVFHIGAYFAEEKKWYNSNNINNIIWFEANPNYESIIKNNVGDDKVIICGVGNKNDIIPFNIANNGQSSSFLEFGTHLEAHPNINFNEIKLTQVKKMIDIVSEHNIDINNYNFLNIDIQGYELEAFKGFDNLLNNFDIIYTEVNEKELYRNCPLITDIDNYLYDFNFIRKLTNITEYGWGDALYIKNTI
ncbi:MAG: FkbM family methyltransferase [Caulobacteraceae bacterium]|nr:FkbM family methyltransferase [Caulobacteraceae bacterium]